MELLEKSGLTLPAADNITTQPVHFDITLSFFILDEEKPFQDITV
ncbi:MAG TPA: hypothetical protein VKO43_06175 [Candidatus Krumholzibacteriaceae bacterium]|nr:hypothetical protein [Candidatus Krumholzibacteriaceae bacterium]